MVEKSNSRDGVRCPRCAAREPHALGRASSEVWWFACSVCAYVWGDPEVVGNAIHTVRGETAEPRAGALVRRQARNER